LIAGYDFQAATEFVLTVMGGAVTWARTTVRYVRVAGPVR
jgi:hypothetical protein